MEKTVSVSKGVFIFKNGQNRNCKRKIQENSAKAFCNDLWYQSYRKLKKALQKQLQILNEEVYRNVLSNLISFIKNAHDKPVNEIPSAALLTGINMPDHSDQFKALTKEVHQKITPHVAHLEADDCQNLKYLIENMVTQIVNNLHTCIDEDYESDKENDKSNLKKSQCTLSVLQAWYENLYGYKEAQVISPRKKSRTKNTKKLLVIIIPDLESFQEKVLQNFIQIISSYLHTLPFVLVFGIATSITALHKCLPCHVSSKISVQLFKSEPSTTHLNSVIENVLFSEKCPFRLGGNVFNLFIDIFLFYDLSVKGFIENCMFALLEHFSTGNAKALCISSRSVNATLELFNHEDLEDVRHLYSFRAFVEEQPAKCRIKLLTDDNYFKQSLEEKVTELHIYVSLFHTFLKCLHILVKDLPKAPFGKQVRELYATATTTAIYDTREYKNCFQLLSVLSRIELTKKLSQISDIVDVSIESLPSLKTYIEEDISKLEEYIEQLNIFDDVAENMKIIADKQNELVFGTKNLSRQELKQKLLELSKQRKSVNPYEKIRTEILGFLSKLFCKYLKEPASKPFYEIFFFDNISIKHQIMGSHRAAIHTALNDPHHYLQCKCCVLPLDESMILQTMPDICITYKLHLECGKMINLYDWLQAFIAILDRDEVEDEDKRIVKPQLQARFTQAVAELEFLGFIKTSKKKSDHVARLTWGG